MLMAQAEAAAGVQGLSVVPMRSLKIVHLIRHGQAFSNIAGEKNHDEYANEKWFDAALSPKGWAQARALGRHIKSVNLRPQLVVVSPLTRALQTASGAFGQPVSGGQDGSSPLLMVEHEEVEGLQVPMQAMSSAGLPPFIAHELCREHLGVHPCDRRRAISHYRERFPFVDFSMVETDTDTWWKPDARETKEEIRARGMRFVQWLAGRQEHEIAVVSHSSFLHFTLSNFTHTPGQPLAVVGELTRWFENCELRTVVLADTRQPQGETEGSGNGNGSEGAMAAGTGLCRTDFPGGNLALAAAPLEEEEA